MQLATRNRWDAYVAGLSRANGNVDVTKEFTVTPTAQQRLENKIQESSAFLKLINMVPVNLQMGNKLGLSIGRPIAGRTDTTGNNERQTKDIAVLDGTNYLCVHTDFDTHIRYDMLDMWAEFPDFAKRVSDMRFAQCALDRQMIGFHGTHAAKESDFAANPLLQDVNKGWLQQVREFAEERVMAEAVTGSGKVKVGGVGSDYKTLDGLVFDMVQMLDTWHRKASDLVVLVSGDLMHDKLFPIVDGQTAPSEMLAAGLVVSQKRLGGLWAYEIPDFPDNTLAVTSFKNLSLYWQKQGRRMHMQERPNKSRTETYESSNDAYVVEDFGKFAMAENIVVDK